jgi:hypothetical protein
MTLLLLWLAAMLAAPTLESVSISTTGNAPGVLVSGTNQLIVECLYSDGSASPCAVSGYASTAPQVATVSASGLLTGIKQGTTKVTATVAGVQSPPLPLAVIKLPAGAYRWTITEPDGVILTGTITIP